MKGLILALALATTALAGCAQLKQLSDDPAAGSSADEEKRPFPRSSDELGLG